MESTTLQLTWFVLLGVLMAGYAILDGFDLLLCCLIFRGVAMEFRSKRPSRLWRGSWDVAFSASSALATFLFGVVVGDCMRGLPLGVDGDITRPLGLADLLNPYSVLTGLFAVSAFAMHGSIYLHLKTEASCRRGSRAGCGGRSFCSW